MKRSPIWSPPFRRPLPRPFLAMLGVLGAGLLVHGLQAVATVPAQASFSPSASGGRAGAPGAPLGRPLAPSGSSPLNYTLADTWRLPTPPLQPIDLALGPAGRLYVADGERNAVLAYGPDGSLRAIWQVWDYALFGRDASFVFVPIAVTVDAGREKVYVLWQRYDDQPGGLVAKLVYLDVRPLDGGTPNPLMPLPSAVTHLDAAAVDPASGDLFILLDGTAKRFKTTQRVLDPAVNVGPGTASSRRLAVTYDGRVAFVQPDDKTVGIFTLGGDKVGTVSTAPNTPVAVAADEAGHLHVLVRAPDPDRPSAPLVLEFDPTGERVRSRSAAALGASPPAATSWPWALAVSADGWAMLSGRGRLQISWSLDNDHQHGQLIGSPVPGGFAPHRPSLITDASIALALGADGQLLALDSEGGQISRFSSYGASAMIAGAPRDAVELAVDPSGNLFVSTLSDAVMRVAPGDVVTPTWQLTCECGLGGRLAVGGGVLYVTRPRDKRVATIDATSGLLLRQISLPDAVGLWPSDVAVGTDGRLFTADLVSAQVQVWRQPTAPEVSWQAGLLSGPRRLAVGSFPDGSRIVAALMADGYVEMHAADGNLVARWAPILEDGAPLAATDIALDREGKVYLAGARSRTVYVFEPGLGVPPTPDETPHPTATPSAKTCRVSGDKRAFPNVVVLGASTTVTLTLLADCPQTSRTTGSDIVLVMDRSTSMKGEALESAKAAARSILELLDVRIHRVGLASFSTGATLDVPLTSSVAEVVDGINRLQAEGETNIAAGLDRAAANLRDFGRRDALPVIILVTDGRYSDRTGDPRPIAMNARNAGTQIFAIGLGSDVDVTLLTDLAGGADHYFAAPTPSQLYPIYQQILRQVLSSLAGNLTLGDRIGDGFSYLANSAVPGALVGQGELNWGRSLLPSSGVTFTYRLSADALGCRPTNVEALASYTDADGAGRQFVFPVPTVCVITPSPTPTYTSSPTATPSPTVTPTPEPVYVFLPIAYLTQCLPGVAHADVVIVIDTSDSMAGAKLDDAKAAAIGFVGQLDLPRDQAALVYFNTEATPGVSLTTSRIALESAIRRLTTRSGTRIDRALQAAARELKGPRRRSTSRPVVVLLSDGDQPGGEAEVVAAATELRQAQGATIFAIGLGDNVNLDLLRRVAGQARTFLAPTGRDLERIYAAIAVTIPCR